MKKHSFYSLMMKNNKPQRVLHTGYSDGTYDYYKNSSTWFAIVPNIGLSVADAHTRKEAQQIATDRAGIVTQKLTERGEFFAARFNNAPIYNETEAI